MFTGIITDIGELISLDKQGDWQLRIKTNWNTKDIEIGASIACSGICLTVLDRKGDYFDVGFNGNSFYYHFTNLAAWKKKSI